MCISGQRDGRRKVLQDRRDRLGQQVQTGRPDPKARKATWDRKGLQDRKGRLGPRATPAR